VSEAPDYVEPTVAWRLWHPVRDGAATRLSSIFHTTVWPARRPLVADCRCLRVPFWPFRRARHDAPAVGCTCGIHAATPATMRSYLPRHFALATFPVVGRVSLWGIVHECERGWRASLAYPETLYVPVVAGDAERKARMIGDLEAYGVPVRTVTGRTPEAVITEVCDLVAA
jgi:hypothetical protein